MTLTFYFQGQIWTIHISGMRRPIDMEWKGSELKWCPSHSVTLNCDHDHDIGISRSIFLITIAHEWDGSLTWNEMDLSQLDVWPPLCDLELWPWPWIFKVKLWNSCIWGMGEQIDMEQKGYESVGCWTHYVTLNPDLDHGFSRLNLEITISQYWVMGGPSDMEWKGYMSW